METLSRTIFPGGVGIEELRNKIIRKKIYAPEVYFNNIPVHEINDPKELPEETFRKGMAYIGKGKNKTPFEIEASCFGRIRTVDGIILPQYNSRPGYAYLLFDFNSKITKVPVHRVVAAFWCELPPAIDISELEVHHITNNGYDNRFSNLIWVTANEHREIEKGILR
jgi:hypothetical protein